MCQEFRCALRIVTPLVFTTTAGGWHFYHLHLLRDEESEAQRCQGMSFLPETHLCLTSFSNTGKVDLLSGDGQKLCLTHDTVFRRNWNNANVPCLTGGLEPMTTRS